MRDTYGFVFQGKLVCVRFKSAAFRSLRSRNDRKSASTENRSPVGMNTAQPTSKFTTTYPPFSTSTRRLSILATRIHESSEKRRVCHPIQKKKWHKNISANATCTSAIV